MRDKILAFAAIAVILLSVGVTQRADAADPGCPSGFSLTDDGSLCVKPALVADGEPACDEGELSYDSTRCFIEANGTQVQIQQAQAAAGSPTYSCPAGYSGTPSASNPVCSRTGTSAETAPAIPSVAPSTLSCPPTYTLLTTTCSRTFPTSDTTAAIPSVAPSILSCPSTYTLLTTTCSRDVTSTETTTPLEQQTCPALYDLFEGLCFGNDETTLNPTINFSCPATYTLTTGTTPTCTRDITTTETTDPTETPGPTTYSCPPDYPPNTGNTPTCTRTFTTTETTAPTETPGQTTYSCPDTTYTLTTGNTPTCTRDTTTTETATAIRSAGPSAPYCPAGFIPAGSGPITSCVADDPAISCTQGVATAFGGDLYGCVIGEPVGSSELYCDQGTLNVALARCEIALRTSTTRAVPSFTG